MRRILLAVALAVSLWPAAVIAFAAERVLGGGDEDAAPAAARSETTARPTTTSTVPSRPRPAAAQASAAPAPAATTSTPAPATAPGEPDLVTLDRLRDDTAVLVVDVSESAAVSAGRPDPELASQALEVESEIVAWQEANEGTNADAEFFAALFADIASAAADFATAPSPEGKERLDEAVERHRRETLQDGI